MKGAIPETKLITNLASEFHFECNYGASQEEPH